MAPRCRDQFGRENVAIVTQLQFGRPTVWLEAIGEKGLTCSEKVIHTVGLKTG